MPGYKRQYGAQAYGAGPSGLGWRGGRAGVGHAATRPSTLPKVAVKRVAGKVSTVARKAARDAQQALALVKRTYRDMEQKVYGAIDSDSALATPLVCNHTLITQGAQVGQRIGEKVSYTRLDLHIRLEQNATRAMVNFRTITFRDKQQVSGTAPGVTDLLNTADTMSHYNLDNQDRFDIMHEEFHCLPSITLGTTGNCKDIYYTVRPKWPITVEYNGGVSTDIEKNGIYTFVIADYCTSAGAVLPLSANDASAWVYSRGYFTDA